MQIISGKAKRINLNVPKGLGVRPTSVRARKALFDSLGNFEEAKVIDLFAGSGALGLEAASRGAAQVVLVEENSLHHRTIKENIEKICKAGVTCKIDASNSSALGQSYFGLIEQPDVIFADPPYPISAACFTTLLENENFLHWGAGALLVWEIPDNSYENETFYKKLVLESTIRKFGTTSFLLANLPELS